MKFALLRFVFEIAVFSPSYVTRYFIYKLNFIKKSNKTIIYHFTLVRMANFTIFVWVCMYVYLSQFGGCCDLCLFALKTGSLYIVQSCLDIYNPHSLPGTEM